MDEHMELVAGFIHRGKFTPTQALIFADLFMQKDVSWTFMPSVVRRVLWDWIRADLLMTVNKTFEDDTRVYEFLAFTKEGLDMIVRRIKR